MLSVSRAAYHYSYSYRFDRIVQHRVNWPINQSFPRYKTKKHQVTAQAIKDIAAQVGERWLVEIASRDDVRDVLGQELVADFNIEFQRLITYSEQATKRGRYEICIRAILADFRNRIIVPLKQARNRGVALPAPVTNPPPLHPLSAFVGQSFNASDTFVNSAVAQLLKAYGLAVTTGERPKGDSVSKKVRERIERADYFVGIFTRRERIRSKSEWTTSTWVIDEKAYALANRKKLVLLRETGVQSIGGIQGDYEYIEFTRDALVDLLIKLVVFLRSLEGEN